MEIQRIPLDQINPAKYNPRKDLKPGDAEYEKLKKSIDEFDLGRDRGRFLVLARMSQ